MHFVTVWSRVTPPDWQCRDFINSKCMNMSHSCISWLTRQWPGFPVRRTPNALEKRLLLNSKFRAGLKLGLEQRPSSSKGFVDKLWISKFELESSSQRKVHLKTKHTFKNRSFCGMHSVHCTLLLATMNLKFESDSPGSAKL